MTRTDRLLTVKEAARILGLAEGTVRNKASDGEIPSVKLGRSKQAPLRFRESELFAWIEEQNQEADDA